MAASAGTEFARSLSIAKDPDAAVPDQVNAAAMLIAYGALDIADPVIDRLEQQGVHMGRLRALSRQLRRSGVLSNYQPLGDASLQEGPPEVLMREAKQPTDVMIVVFSGMEKRFFVSLQVLDRFLNGYRAHILYLADHSSSAFLNGLPNAAPSYPEMLELIRQSASTVGASRLFVMATSVGGFTGLRAAADLHAEAFLGLGIRTDLSTAARQEAGSIVKHLADACRDETMLIDLRPYLEATQWPARSILIAGDSHEVDAYQIERLRGLPRIDLSFLERYSQHDVVLGLVERGLLQEVLDRFLNVPGAGP